MDNLSLEDAVSSFNLWRMARKTRKEPIPENLRVMAASLYPSHKRALICKHLGLSGSQLSKYISDNAPVDNVGFVMAKADMSQTAKAAKEPNDAISMTLYGKERSLHFSISSCLFPEVIKQLEGLL